MNAKNETFAIAGNHGLNWPMIAAAAFTVSFYGSLYLLIFG